ncbi:hypothetical protein MAXJ12_32484 [Mesorhizobium alhagi CCNWXJ12-2]|uniref:Antitoxin Xre/MbcA/ParS-like toxin-binding domain-containing protein n=1 Tax=Mesorhizobium alhagi CCNWXJ12-2 TaxID=1107882 RepID=H0I201_9HYPH|nr:hypothetical protein MAXJ12_32484 [Mesorhizobium alhagi CCNWXJ12-2]
MEPVTEKASRAGSLGDEALTLTFMDWSGAIAIARVADSFGMSKTQLAETVGLARESLCKAARHRTSKTQMRIKEMLEIISRVTEWAGGKEQAMAWYRAKPIPAFGDRTAEALVKEGKAGAVRDYLDHLAVGGFASRLSIPATATMIRAGPLGRSPARGGHSRRTFQPERRSGAISIARHHHGGAGQSGPGASDRSLRSLLIAKVSSI